MPQDSLWAASARPVGFTISYVHHETGGEDKHVLTMSPTWSKTPSGRPGNCTLVVPSFALWHMPEVIRAGIYQYLGGQAKDVGPVAYSKLQDVLAEFSEGARS